jgi:succinate dehydrogenase/fumarate reductase-like Fe-S protein
MGECEMRVRHRKSEACSKQIAKEEEMDKQLVPVLSFHARKQTSVTNVKINQKIARFSNLNSGSLTHSNDGKCGRRKSQMNAAGIANR